MRWILALLAVLVIAAVATQLIIPRVAESQTEDRLTKDGGTADVNIEAVPAVRLLFDDGDKLEVRAREVDIPIDDIQGKSFKEFDGFNEVDVRLAISKVGPFFAERVTITRGEDDGCTPSPSRGARPRPRWASLRLRGCRRCCARP